LPWLVGLTASVDDNHIHALLWSMSGAMYGQRLRAAAWLTCGARLQILLLNAVGGVSSALLDSMGGTIMMRSR
jgi:hypothetical protein